ncbi:threonine ammonia-lyase [Planococcus lenghuensis]|uniref:threonine ammonia-lyase n=1 Tax=Planococcus lenghuensis TaxID=2213202 RepID=A0A1Q2KWB4_9BACL|nr:threonine/serine dehydratase [Planococcus lenghuensis]AQQ51962.1 serine/threonine dehydratase [Planococcus lenghuensis]
MITLRDVEAAREEIYKVIHETPVLTSTLLNEQCGSQIYLKSEHLQKTGSFKIRGAANKVRHAVKDGATLITAASSGNHGQAVAYMARETGVRAVIAVPEDASAAKVAAIRAYGAEVEFCGLTSAERIPRARDLAETGAGIYVPPYDDPLIMAGQGTCGLELLEQVPDVEVIVVPVGGGGLISGILTAIKESNPRVKVIGVEPQLANDTYLSLQNKEITPISGTDTIADGLRTSQPGDLTFPIVQKYLDDLILVTEDEIREALQFLMERSKQLVEPSGAVSVAALLSGKLKAPYQNVAAVLSGGNLDLRSITTYLPS